MQYIASIKIVFEADNDADAADAISGMFTDNLQAHGIILDWSYDQHDSDYEYPAPVPAHLVDKWDDDDMMCVLTGRDERQDKEPDADYYNSIETPEEFRERMTSYKKLK